jgi:hypothetical protein
VLYVPLGRRNDFYCKVGLIVIGQVKPFDAPVVSMRYVEAGHDHFGREVEPLNVEPIVDAVEGKNENADSQTVSCRQLF